jgi:hypothetical protein
MAKLCALCKTELKSPLQEYGYVQAPVCWSCFSRVEGVACHCEDGRDECSECSGEGVVSCNDCFGDGDLLCEECEGDGCDECSKTGRVDCDTCGGGLGKLYCELCHGTGRVNCDFCDGSGVIAMSLNPESTFFSMVRKYAKVEIVYKAHTPFSRAMRELAKEVCQI